MILLSLETILFFNPHLNVSAGFYPDSKKLFKSGTILYLAGLNDCLAWNILLKTSLYFEYINMFYCDINSN